VYAIPPLAHSKSEKKTTKLSSPFGKISFGQILFYLEAWTGIEPVNSGFADHCLTAWLPRRFDYFKKNPPVGRLLFFTL
jgi:hypothetical protein